VGLLAEEYDPVDRRLLGNFPQALSHVALVNTACHLSSGAESGDGVVRVRGVISLAVRRASCRSDDRLRLVEVACDPRAPLALGQQVEL